MKDKTAPCSFECEEKMKKMVYEDVRELDRRWETPFYLFGAEKLRGQCDELRDRFGSGVDICYSLKTNPFILPVIKEKIGYVEVCSEGELDICRSLGIPGEKIIYEGILKTQRGIERALEYRVHRITIESVGQWRQVEKAAEGRSFSVILRLTCGNQFGLTAGEIVSLIRENRTGMQVEGIHYYSGTQKSDADGIRGELADLWSAMEDIEERSGMKLRELEIGCGIGMPHFQTDSAQEFQAAMDSAAEVLTSWSRRLHIVYEAGRFLTAPAGIFVTRIFDKKEREGRSFLFVDGGSNHLRYYGSMLGQRNPVIRGLSRAPSGTVRATAVCGPLCTGNDILARSVKLDSGLAPGDYLAFYYAGAYSVTDSPLNFLSMETPAILLDCGKDEVLPLRGHLQTWPLNKPEVSE